MYSQGRFNADLCVAGSNRQPCIGRDELPNKIGVSGNVRSENGFPSGTHWLCRDGLTVSMLVGGRSCGRAAEQIHYS